MKDESVAKVHNNDSENAYKGLKKHKELIGALIIISLILVPSLVYLLLVA